MDPLDLNLRHLRALVAVAQTGTVAAAAVRIAVTQPALTQAIAKLERQLDTPLFVRRSDGMDATEAMRVLIPRIEAALTLIASSRVTAAQARALIAVADAGSYAGASAATGLAQPSLHRCIGDLSIALRRALVVREGKGIKLTEAGRKQARGYRLARAELAAGLAELATLSGRETGRIAIGAMPLARARVLPRAVALFHRAHPQVNLAIIEGSHAELIDPLRDGALDLLIGALRDVPEPDLTQRALFADRPMVIARAGHPLAGTAPTTGALAAYPWILAAQGTPLRQQWQAMFADAGVPVPDVPIESGSVIAIRQILRETDFLTLLSPDQVVVEIEAGLLIVLGETPPALRRTIGITTRSEWRPTALQRAFLAILERASPPRVQ
jgi:DNA-binding transcriptional LysR family regulator